ncbi:hypothetical protein CLV46_2490 [Diaminobutyricimonas aerilata]|uniref:Uncharacterized protein n=1 Tax=Diaminobutyricimonas aerilata TaxID=1162967 RepID=A0A2M9CLY3_9MICO|nr:hypothetical protein [Diaminobutyricimonas aerilata]PJJ72911.1 hypothetical protein CLV46_2490 [Diaminobutyricimonas aerilata]
MSASRSIEYRRAAQWSRWWATRYTRGLPPEVANERLDELAADLHDHSAHADATGMTGRALAVAIVSRSLRGVPADLAWRAAQRRVVGGARIAFSGRHLPVTLLVIAITASALFAIGGMLMSLTLASQTLRDQQYAEVLALTIVVSIALVCGLALLARRITRSIGALWLIGAVFGMGHLVIHYLTHYDTVLTPLLARLPDWPSFVVAESIGAALLYLAVAVWWLPISSTPIETEDAR